MFEAGEVFDGLGFGVECPELGELVGGDVGAGVVEGFADGAVEVFVGDEDGFDRVLRVVVDAGAGLLESDDGFEVGRARREVDEVAVEVDPPKGGDVFEGFDRGDGVVGEGEGLDVGDGGERGEAGEVVFSEGEAFEGGVVVERGGVGDAVAVERKGLEVRQVGDRLDPGDAVVAEGEVFEVR